MLALNVAQQPPPWLPHSATSRPDAVTGWDGLGPVATAILVTVMARPRQTSRYRGTATHPPAQ